ncbi:hypothetical protein PVL29_004033 [Vitis rotundifolia]|uniref:Myb-related protein 123 n=1 Tax=Vitis rotundifolia TaxID=103349 RepID=A0AA39E0E7_VITRO|nr:hypothetical protein PVL29_004033 [Vitis rotundifolia]
MGRSPCCSKEGLNRGAWTALEDKILTAYIKAHGEGKWRNLPKRAGLKRCGKSCRLRWLNYLRPDIKRGNISHDEEELIIRLHKLLGNRWSLIAGRLPGRTDNEIKNYWNTTLGKKIGAQPTNQSRLKSKPPIDHKPTTTEPEAAPAQPQVIRTKATRCTKVLMPTDPPPRLSEPRPIDSTTPQNPLQAQPQQTHSVAPWGSTDFTPDYGTTTNSNLFNEDYSNSNLLQNVTPFKFEDWASNDCLENNATLDLDSLAFLLNSEEWP